MKSWFCVAAAALCVLPGCTGVQSSLAPAGREADRIALLFWWMAGGAVAVWIGVVALALWCERRQARPSRVRLDRWLIVGGGVVVPVVVLTVLLAYGLASLPPLVARAPEQSLQVVVTGEQWWWRVRYLVPSGAVDVANEIRLPIGEPVQFRLESDNVIHSFWIPSLAGKMDMIPGRTTYLALQPTTTGRFRGACAEYCGLSHAGMAFDVEVMDRSTFAAWLENQASAAQSPTTPAAARGRDLFFSSGCSACHTVRGTAANGVIGPDLTHVGSRRSLAAGVLMNDPLSIRRWLTAPRDVKPGAHMPRFDMLPSDDVDALAAYLEDLR